MNYPNLFTLRHEYGAEDFDGRDGRYICVLWILLPLQINVGKREGETRVVHDLVYPRRSLHRNVFRL